MEYFWKDLPKLLTMVADPSLQVRLAGEGAPSMRQKPHIGPVCALAIFAMTCISLMTIAFQMVADNGKIF